MYDYRKMTPEERAEIVAQRKACGWPWHAPPHFGGQEELYLITAACYEHREVMAAPTRLTEFAEALVLGLKSDLGIEVQAWVVLPNHYHLLVSTDLDVFRPWIARIHNGKSTQWNREDRSPGRRVWHRFADRKIRSEGHYYASLNYIHANPVKHGYVEKADDWPWSSLPGYLEGFGRDVLVDWWKRYPVGDYGRGWDD
jgi:putative transposase